ncbi:hypothetical protein [Micromonospora sp. C28ISP2-4]|uniref:hypothetical protein n=1 Tax=Micromonospora sp. C28ISP2-4 TaxID=3059523 RepID=UPI0026755726|nr:hypothetical protein [Micromonospora sp. C28ISP2-4]MDO3684015.1 hypothetical protein [Micromonospora sp. C28ISP2-4]
MTSDDATPRSYPVELTTRQWQIIDGTVDSEVSVEAENGDPRGVVELGQQIRIAGWDQVAHWTPGVPGSGNWPPDGQVVSVTLLRDQWALVCSSLTRWAKVSERLGDVESASASRVIRDLVVAQVREHDPMWGTDLA